MPKAPKVPHAGRSISGVAPGVEGVRQPKKQQHPVITLGVGLDVQPADIPIPPSTAREREERNMLVLSEPARHRSRVATMRLAHHVRRRVAYGLPPCDPATCTCGSHVACNTPGYGEAVMLHACDCTLGLGTACPAPLCPEAQQYLLHTEACSCNVCIEAKRGCEDCAQCILDRGTRVLVRDTTKEGFGFGFGVVLGIQPSAGSAGSGGSLVHVLKTMRPSALVPGDHITHMNDRPVADMSWAAIHALLCAADSTLRLRVSNAVGGAPLSAISHWYKPGTGVWLFVPAESGKPAILLNRKTASALEDALATTTGTVTINLTPSTASAAAATAPAARVVHMGTLQVLDEPQGGSKVVIGRLVWGPARPVRPAKPAGLAESVQPPGDVAAAAARVEASCPWVQVTAVEQVQAPAQWATYAKVKEAVEALGDQANDKELFLGMGTTDPATWWTTDYLGKAIYLSDVAPCVVNEGGCLLIVRVVCGHEFDGGTKDNVSMAGPPPLFDTVKVGPTCIGGSIGLQYAVYDSARVAPCYKVSYKRRVVM